jgi:amino acid transporter
VSAAEVFFAMFGFDQAIQLGESSNPRRNVPLAVIGSVLIGTALYILLQVAFLAAVNPDDLAKGWRRLRSRARRARSQVFGWTGLSWLAALLYIDAGISPAGTGWSSLRRARAFCSASAETGTYPRSSAALTEEAYHSRVSQPAAS